MPLTNLFRHNSILFLLTFAFSYGFHQVRIVSCLYGSHFIYQLTPTIIYKMKAESKFFTFIVSPKIKDRDRMEVPAQANHRSEPAFENMERDTKIACAMRPMFTDFIGQHYEHSWAQMRNITVNLFRFEQFVAPYLPSYCAPRKFAQKRVKEVYIVLFTWHFACL